MPTTCPECNHDLDEHGAGGCGREHRDPALGAYPFGCECPMTPEAITERRAAQP